MYELFEFVFETCSYLVRLVLWLILAPWGWCHLQIADVPAEACRPPDYPV